MHAGPEQGGSGPDLLIVHLDAQDLSTQGECSQHAPDDPPHSSVPLGEPLGTDGGALGLQWVDKLVGRLLAQKAVGGGYRASCVYVCFGYLNVTMCVLACVKCKSVCVCVHVHTQLNMFLGQSPLGRSPLVFM
eukprot:scaffold125999_cov25-Tisochrysis_lutea.AAC.4